MKITFQRVLFFVLGCTWALSPAHAALVAYYPFNGTGNDQTGTNTNLRLVGDATYGPSLIGGLGSALSVDGVGDGAIGQNFVKITSNNLTIVAWAKANSLDGDWNSLVKNWGVSDGGQFHFGLGFAAVNTLQNIAGGSTATAPAVFPAGQWVHAAFVLDAAAGEHRLYINGTAVATAAYAGTLTAGGAGITGLGVGVKPNDDGSATGDANGPGYWNGLIDDVGIYNEALSTAQIAQIVQNGNAGIQLDGTSVPEPGSMSLAVVAGSVVLCRRRWR